MPGHTLSISLVLYFVLIKILLGREIITPSLQIGKQAENDELTPSSVLTERWSREGTWLPPGLKFCVPPPL